MSNAQASDLQVLPQSHQLGARLTNMVRPYLTNLVRLSVIGSFA